MKIKYGINNGFNNNINRPDINSRTIYGSDYSFVYHYQFNCENDLTVISSNTIKEFGIQPCQKCVK